MEMVLFVPTLNVSAQNTTLVDIKALAEQNAISDVNKGWFILEMESEA